MSWIRKVKITQNRRGGLKYGSFLKALITIAKPDIWTTEQYNCYHEVELNRQMYFLSKYTN
mgnify:CR=1 FL=1